VLFYGSTIRNLSATQHTRKVDIRWSQIEERKNKTKNFVDPRRETHHKPSIIMNEINVFNEFNRID
jgi:hypothetical protein